MLEIKDLEILLVLLGATTEVELVVVDVGFVDIDEVVGMEVVLIEVVVGVSVVFTEVVVGVVTTAVVFCVVAGAVVFWVVGAASVVLAVVLAVVFAVVFFAALAKNLNNPTFSRSLSEGGGVSKTIADVAVASISTTGSA